MKPVRVAPPAEPVVTLAEAKAHLRVNAEGEGSLLPNEDDSLITGLIAAATEHLDGWAGILGRCLVNQDWRIDLPAWPATCIALPFSDVSSVTVNYFDQDDVEQTLSSSEYELAASATGTVVRFKKTFSRPALNDDRADAVQVTMTAGYGAAADVPQPIKQAILLLVGAWYENREETVIGTIASPLPDSVAVNALITPYRRVMF
ncbi:head-tail connector protein [Mesorhizobium xinjiangense]|uniref:head-tail connector protein n=1 Tax=Mesorhizobium xinjiangense TaxID=2678685 RepID=UPI0012ECBEFA|nr:head-tail connector protein [Mesorhizobium xinjiangense]